jgi:hypothetical protein
MKFERGQLVNYVLSTRPGKITLPVIVLKRTSFTHIYEVYDIVGGNKLLLAQWSLEA